MTAIHPRGKGDPGDPCAAATYSLNGNGEMTGVTWIEESGTLALPIAITNTHAVGVAHEAIIHWVGSRHPELADMWMLPVAAETWDGYLNDINGGHVTREHVLQALDAATGGPIEEGSVGGGTGMNCYSFKGGNGTASRTISVGLADLHGRHAAAVQLRSAPRAVDRRRAARRRAGRRRPAEATGWSASRAPAR